MRLPGLAAALLLLGAQASVPLELPEPIELPRAADAAEVGRALRAALARRGWQVRADTRDALTADRAGAGPSLRIRLDYSARQVRFRYVDSTALGHEEHKGEHFIDAHANQWLRELDEEIRRQIQRADLEPAPVEVVPVSPPPDAPRPPEGGAPAPGSSSSFVL